MTTEPTEPVEPTYSSLVIRVEYTLDDPRNGVVFVQKDDEIAPYVSFLCVYFFVCAYLLIFLL